MIELTIDKNKDRRCPQGSLLDWKRLETPLPHMPAPAVVPVLTPDMRRHEMRPTKVLAAKLEHYMLRVDNAK